MGEVYRARDTRLDRTVAIKVLSEHVAAAPDVKQRFEREAKTLASLSHPHICNIHDVGSQDGIDFLVMEYLEGETLEQRLKKGAALPLGQALQLGIQIADALAAAHRAGVIHRDLKPGNIILTKSGTKLLDFGLAKLRPVEAVAGMSIAATVADPLTAQGTILGTLHYMAPEQVEGRDADVRSDIWSLGALLYEIVTGRRPFEGDTPASVIGSILKDVPLPPSSRQPLAPAALDHLVTRCLAKDPDSRWQSAADVGIQLEWIKNLPVVSAVDRPARHHRRMLISSAAIGVATLLAIATAFLMTGASSTITADPVVATAGRVTHETGFSEWPTMVARWQPVRVHLEPRRQFRPVRGS